MNPSEQVGLLAQPLTLRSGAILPNRLCKSAMSEALSTPDNRVSPGLLRLYSRWAMGGIGLNITGNVMVDRRALGEPGNVVVENPCDIQGLSEWARAAQGQGGAVWMQLNHPGKQAPKGLNLQTVSPSAVPFSPGLQRFFATPRALTDAEILDIVEHFAHAAAIAQQAGFDGVQIHGAHGYLVSQFLSPRHNLRDDAWGGDAPRRRRFVIEVYRAIRAATGKGFSVGIKLNSADFQRGGFDQTESLALMQALDAEGIDLLEVSGGTYESPKMSIGLDAAKSASTLAREAYFLDFAVNAKATVRAPLLVTGGFRTLAGMAQALATGGVDLIGLARPLAIEPDLPRRLFQGLDPQYRTPARVTTGVAALDKLAIMEIAFYARQLRRMAAGKEPLPTESPLKAGLVAAWQSGWKGWQSRRQRA